MGLYHSDHRSLQERFDTLRLADRLEKVKVLDHIADDDRAFIEARDMFFIATTDASGRPSCSYKGGDPGFVRVLDAHTLVFPNYDGNGMYLTMGNVRQTAQVGLLFIDFDKQKRLRVNGSATLEEVDCVPPTCPEAQFVVRVAVREVFPNCPRHIHKLALVERSKFVPRSGVHTPVPGWKQTDWARDVLPANDPARKT